MESLQTSLCQSRLSACSSSLANPQSQHVAVKPTPRINESSEDLDDFVFDRAHYPAPDNSRQSESTPNRQVKQRMAPKKERLDLSGGFTWVSDLLQ
jgi:hypothetical protein